jgi:hypothetical protein
MSDLYDTDILIWSERQAELLRRVAAGEPVNEAPDWPNIIEEVESVGSEQRHAVESAAGAGVAAHAEGRGVAALSGCAELAGGRDRLSPTGQTTVHALHAAADRRGGPLCRRDACAARDDRRSAAAASAAGLPGHAGRAAERRSGRMIPRGRRQMKAAAVALAMVVFVIGLAWWRG